MILYEELRSSKKKECVSIIDLGYNSIKISTYDIYKNGHYIKKNQQQEYVQIGSNLFRNDNNISYSNIERTVKALNKFKKDLKELDTDVVIPIATSAVRDAINEQEVIKTIKKNSGFEFNVLSGYEEGFFSYLGAQSSMHIPNGLFLDLGGGSLEMIYVQNFKITKIIGMDLGALRLYERFITNGESEIETNYKYLEEYLYEKIPSIDDFGFDASYDMRMVGIGGTIRSISKFISKIFQILPPFSHSHVPLSKKRIDLTNGIFSRLSDDDLLHLKSIEPQRAKIMATGGFVIRILMEKLKFNDLLVCPTGLREGILENYLYFKMDKDYKRRKKFIGLNYEPSSILSSTSKDIFNSSTVSSVLTDDWIPQKIIGTKVNKIKV